MTIVEIKPSLVVSKELLTGDPTVFGRSSERSRYMTLETIAAIGDDAAVPGLPNMAA